MLEDDDEPMKKLQTDLKNLGAKCRDERSSIYSIQGIGVFLRHEYAHAQSVC